MARWRRSLKSPGGPPLTAKRALYIKLMNQQYRRNGCRGQQTCVLTR